MFIIKNTFLIIPTAFFANLDSRVIAQQLYRQHSEVVIAQSSSSIVGRWANICCGGKFLRIRDFQSNGNFSLYSSFLNNNGQANSLNSIGQGSYQTNGNNIKITEAHNNGQVFTINCVLKGNVIECQSADGTEIWKKQ